MIDLNIDPSDTRPKRQPETRSWPAPNLRIVLFGLAGASALAGFGVAASTVMAGLAAPPPVKIVSSGRAADWPELKDGLPAVAGSIQPAPAPAKPAEPETPALRMALLPEAFTPAAAPAKSASPAMPAPAKDAAPPVSPTQRIPTPTAVTPVAQAREVTPLVPLRTAALQAPRASETVRARELVEPVAPAPKPVPVTEKPARPEKPAHPDKTAPKAVATRKPAEAVKTAGKAKGAAPATVAQAEPAEPEETEVLGIKLPSLAPAGRKLKESVDALGDAVRNVF